MTQPTLQQCQSTEGSSVPKDRLQSHQAHLTVLQTYTCTQYTIIHIIHAKMNLIGLRQVQHCYIWLPLLRLIIPMVEFRTRSDISLKTRRFGLHFRSRRLKYIFNHFYAVRAQSYGIHWNNAKSWPLRRSRLFQVTDFGTNRKLMYDFLLLIDTNLPPILHRVRDSLR